MAPPAAKKRKTQHSDDADHIEASFSDEMSSASELSDSTSQDPVEIDEDISMDGVEDTDHENALSRGLLKQKPLVENKKKPLRREAISEDGVYTAEVYKSNLFKLQVDELLEQVKPKYGKKEAPAENAMRTLKAIIEQIPNRTPLSILDAEKVIKKNKVEIPFPDPRPPKDALYKLQYERPSSINATGSYPLKTATRTRDDLVIDMVVTMPKALFQEKDYLNYRYFYKRAYYLACLAAGIKASTHNFKLSFECLNGNHLQPILVVRSTADGGPDDFSSSKCRIQIIPAVPEKTFAEIKLQPSANCVRPKISGDELSTEILKPTTFYNATLQADSSITSYLKLLHAASSKSQAYKDACVLGRVWLGQRGFGAQIQKGGFGNFEWAAITAILLQSNPGAGAPSLSPGYSSYQLFKATIQFLANRDLIKSPYKFQVPDIVLPKSESTPVFFDGPRNLNILFKMTPWSYALLREEAKLTIQALSDTTFDQFDSTFILKVHSVQYRYDATLEIPISSLGIDKADGEFDESFNQICRKLHTVILKALTDRVKMVSLQLPHERPWHISSHRSAKSRNAIFVHLSTDPINMNRKVDHGPPIENKKEVASFLQFWGDMAERRRFRDGSILECIDWSAKDGSLGFTQTITFVLGKHLGPKVTDGIRFNHDVAAKFISSGRIVGQSGTTAFLPLMNALSALEKDIRSLEGLPLQIRHIVATDSQLRYSSIDLAFTTTKTLMHTPASIIVQFEGSGRWPDDLSAIQRTKIAFLLKLSDLLASARPSYTTRLGLENPSEPSQNQAYLELILPSGPAFRLRIHHDREATLIERQLKDKTLDGPSRESASLALAAYKRDFLRLPAHTQAVQKLCTRFPALSPSIRLTKKWFASHLLMPHFAEEFIELLVVQTFLQPYPWQVPACATTGFLRSIAWISRWDWRHTPLIVDFSSELGNEDPLFGASGAEQSTEGMKAEDVNKIQTRFEAWRRIDPALNRVVLFAATNLDTEGTTWTDKSKPEKAIAVRMTALARATVEAVRKQDEALYSVLEEGGENHQSVDSFSSETLFLSDYQDYSFLLHVSPACSKSGKRSKESKFKNLQIQQEIKDASDIQNVGFDPIETFVNDLQAIYGDAILWFWDPDSLDVIAGLWNPDATSQRAWKIKAGWNSAPITSNNDPKRKANGEVTERDSQIVVNVNAVLHEIGRLGGELVERIEIL